MMKNSLIILLLSIVAASCGDSAKTYDPQLMEAREATITMFDALPAVEQGGFLATFKPSADYTASQAFTGQDLDDRLEFIRDLDSELRSRRK